MMKPITGQYECVHRSGVGLDYFTSRIDRLTLQGNGHFVLILQDTSRVANAAKSLMSGQQVNASAPETRREGNYTYSGNGISLYFNDGVQEQGQIAYDGQGITLGTNFFTKVSDSTLLPPTHRLQKDMEDIAKGLKIAKTIGGMAIGAVKTISETLQTADQSMKPSTPPAQTQNPGTSWQAPLQSPPPPPPAQPVQNTAPPPSPAQGIVETLYCDQCGARVRPGKPFCNQCGSRLF
jgi:hypothetical protein